jgi:hypothetical protein
MNTSSRFSRLYLSYYVALVRVILKTDCCDRKASVLSSESLSALRSTCRIRPAWYGIRLAASNLWQHHPVYRSKDLVVLYVYSTSVSYSAIAI